MVAIIKTGHSIRRVFQYNEQKVKEGVADLIMAGNYPKDLSDLTESNRLNLLLKQVKLNENVTRNSVHISLNFDPSEQLPNEKLSQIAEAYMERIGFGEQPYLVYKHNDSGHPHIHIVSIKVRADGRRIDTQNIGKNLSEPARKELESKYGLVKAEDRKKTVDRLRPVNVSKVQYGTTETRRSIANVLSAVLDDYNFTSLPELNAILNLYNVSADRGSEESRVYNRNGLLFRLIDDKGNRVGVPIKASRFYANPTLKNLEERFKRNLTLRSPFRNRIKNALDFTFLKNKTMTLDKLIGLMKKEGIAIVLRKNVSGYLYGITYVDFKTKCVFNGSALGKEYTANALQERCTSDQTLHTHIHGDTSKSTKGETTNEFQPGHPDTVEFNETGMSISEDLIQDLIGTESIVDFLPYPLKKGKKKRKKRNTPNR